MWTLIYAEKCKQHYVTSTWKCSGNCFVSALRGAEVIRSYEFLRMLKIW